MNRASRTFLAALSGAVIAAAAGCSGSTTSGTVYSLSITRHVEAYLAYNHEVIYNTALETLENTFRYRIEKSELDGRTGYIKARTAKDNTVTFSVTRDSDVMSEVSVFVGPVGDEEAAQDILSRIEKALR
ncbi:MAG: DUF3568 family protein [Phycisphaeraceae bacterium]|nr:DUF3568 family protein [Phycisphaeraceae bacterium]